jgi:hypothetical protein
MTALATTTVAVYVARISRRQWQTNQEKLRFDLYNRRFEIYLRVLDFHQALIVWEGTDEQVALQAPFIKAYRESRFLFPDNSGIYSFLKEFFDHSFVIANFHEVPPLSVIGTEEFTKQSNKRTASANWILKSIGPLEQKLSPFLNFHEL